ncbi:unnamed protein product [Caenorhabditis sp. 36 PRJEB53466]|nr:unnamed protein product [Caenorhabditis sp. 36 PRJEB53466]
MMYNALMFVGLTLLAIHGAQCQIWKPEHLTLEEGMNVEETNEMPDADLNDESIELQKEELEEWEAPAEPQVQEVLVESEAQDPAQVQVQEGPFEQVDGPSAHTPEPLPVVEAFMFNSTEVDDASIGTESNISMIELVELSAESVPESVIDLTRGNKSAVETVEHGASAVASALRDQVEELVASSTSFHLAPLSSLIAPLLVWILV